MKDELSRRQLTALAFVCLLSPLVRRVPGPLCDAAGRAGWISLPLTAVPLLALTLLYAGLRRRAGNRSADTLALEALGALPGRLLLAPVGLWMVFCAGFVLAVGSDRLIATIYPACRRAFFILTLLAVCLLCARGGLRALARSAMVFRPVLLLVFLFVFVFTLPKIHPGELLPVSFGDTAGVLKGTALMTGSFSFPVFLSFWEDRVREPFRMGPFFFWVLTGLLLAEGVFTACVGLLGLLPAQEITHPFFAVVRDLSVFGLIEHVEALIIGVWVFSDLVLVSMLLKTAARLLGRCLFRRQTEKSARILTLLCALGAGAGALLLPDGWRLEALDRGPILLVQAALALLLLPLCFILWWFRSKKRP